jgi:hypothetical protein
VKGKFREISKSSFKRRPYHSLSNNEPNKLLGHYLAGLIEGDGSIIVPKTITLRALRALGCCARNPKGKLGQALKFLFFR